MRFATRRWFLEVAPRHTEGLLVCETVKEVGVPFFRFEKEQAGESKRAI